LTDANGEPLDITTAVLRVGHALPETAAGCPYFSSRAGRPLGKGGEVVVR